MARHATAILRWGTSSGSWEQWNGAAAILWSGGGGGRMQRRDEMVFNGGRFAMAELNQHLLANPRELLLTPNNPFRPTIASHIVRHRIIARRGEQSVEVSVYGGV